MTQEGSYLPLTQENLDLLLEQYEKKIENLDPLVLPKDYQVNFRWLGPRNRFFDVRWDNRAYNERRCSRWGSDWDSCSDDTDTNGDFVERACPERLEYDYDLPDQLPTRFDGHPDKYRLRVLHGYWGEGRKGVINLASIPRIQRNLRRLDRELVRQENFKWCMAHVRSRGLGRHWSLLNETGELVRIQLPREILVLIMYWATF